MVSWLDGKWLGCSGLRRTWLGADAVLVAAGAHSGRLHPGPLRDLVRPVKGEIVRLRHRAGALAPPSRTVRGLGRRPARVPRAARRWRDWWSAPPSTRPGSSRGRGWVACVTCSPMPNGWCRGSPSTRWWRWRPGFRPGTPWDNMPLIGALSDGVLVATGHGRSGMLLAPITADTVLALLTGEPVGRAASAAEPERLSCTAARR